MVVKNLKLIEQYLVMNGFEEIKATPHEWQKHFHKNVCRIDLTGDNVVSTWSPLDDYSNVSADFSKRPVMMQAVLDVNSLYETGKLPQLIGRTIEVPVESLNDPVLDGKPLVKEPPAQNTPEHTAPVPGIDEPQLVAPHEKVTPPMPVPSIVPKDKDQTEQHSNSGPSSPHQKSILDMGQIDAGEQPPTQFTTTPASLPSESKRVEEMPKKIPDIPFNANDIMNKKMSSPIPDRPSSQDKTAATPKVQNPPALVDVADLDKQMSKSATARWLQGRGKTYNVHGENRPDAAQIQGAANLNKVSTEIIKAVQVKEYAEVIVRTHYQGQYVDTIVHQDFDNSRHILMLEMAIKHPEIVDSYTSEGYPIFIPGATITDKSNKVKNAMTTIIHTLLSDIQFSIRDCTTKAASAGQAKILNRDWREESEVNSEQHERDMVKQSIENKA